MKSFNLILLVVTLLSEVDAATEAGNYGVPVIQVLNEQMSDGGLGKATRMKELKNDKLIHETYEADQDGDGIFEFVSNTFYVNGSKAMEIIADGAMNEMEMNGVADAKPLTRRIKWYQPDKSKSNAMLFITGENENTEAYYTKDMRHFFHVYAGMSVDWASIPVELRQPFADLVMAVDFGVSPPGGPSEARSMETAALQEIAASPRAASLLIMLANQAVFSGKLYALAYFYHTNRAQYEELKQAILSEKFFVVSLNVHSTKKIVSREDVIQMIERGEFSNLLTHGNAELGK